MKIYCSGIGGIGLSAYASLQRVAGHDVSGSDRSDSALLDDLRSQGITIHLDQSGTCLTKDIDLFVYSEAIPPDAPERKKATEYEIHQQSYPEALGELSKGFETVIAVCGTHGKSSTTGMAARLLMHSGREPTVVVGTKLKELDGRNWRKGRPGGVFLLEACEYRNSFHNYSPTVILMTNCDGDHFDFYASLENYRESFRKFLATLPPQGLLITHMADPDCFAVAAAAKQVVDADAFPLIPLKTPGRHMQKNAQLVLALAKHLDIPDKQAQAAVSGYAGSWRRLELKGTVKGLDIPVIDDYAHHPKEIRATLDALIAEYPKRRIVCVFQPHTHDRTLKLYDAFTESFTGVDTVIVTDVYEARKDIETEKVDMPAFINDIASESSVRCLPGESLTETEELLRGGMLQPSDLLVCLGAGDITQLAATMIL